MEINSKKKVNFGFTIFMLVLALTLFIFSFIQQLNKSKEEKKISDTVTKKLDDFKKEIPKKLEENKIDSSKYKIFYSLKNLKKLEIAKDTTNWVPKGKKSNIHAYKKNIIVSGSFSKIYLYVKVSVHDEPLLRAESVYLKIWNIIDKEGKTGGHLFRPLTLPIPNSKVTEMLFDLKYIPYIKTQPYNEDDMPLETNWNEMFKDSTSLRLLTFISSKRKATIEEISIYYKCDGANCGLQIIDKKKK